MAPGGGAPTVAVAEPDCAPPVSKPEPLLVPAEQENANATVIPTSATCGWQESSARRGVVGGVEVAVLEATVMVTVLMAFPFEVSCAW